VLEEPWFKCSIFLNIKPVTTAKNPVIDIKPVTTDNISRFRLDKLRAVPFQRDTIAKGEIPAQITTKISEISTKIHNKTGDGHPRSFLRLSKLFLPTLTAPANSHATSCIERASSSKLNSDRADGHCYSFAWI